MIKLVIFKVYCYKISKEKDLECYFKEIQQQWSLGIIRWNVPELLQKNTII